MYMYFPCKIHYQEFYMYEEEEKKMLQNADTCVF